MTEAKRAGYSGINCERAKYNNNVIASPAAKGLERERRALRERTGAPVIVKKKVKASPFPASFIFYTVITMVMLMFIVYNNSVVNEISYDIAECKASITEEKARNEKLKMELENKYDLKEIENIAVNELGLVKSTEVVKHYVSISGGDKVVVSKDTSDTQLGFATGLDTLKKSVAHIYE